MNIFAVDSDIHKCAENHADQHVSKTILESAQMLCTVLNQLGEKTPYRSAHQKHPCVLWTGTSLSNWTWLRSMALCLNEEYKYRFDKTSDHRSALVIKELPELTLDDCSLTQFVQVMPEVFKVPGDAVQAYRNFYIREKSSFATWTKRESPAWYLQGFINVSFVQIECKMLKSTKN